MSGSVAQSLGVISIVWGGKTYNVDSKSASFMPGGSQAKMVQAGNQISAAFDGNMPSSVKVSFPLQKGQTVVGLQASNGSELQVVADSGQTWTIEAAYITKIATVKGGAGNNVSVEFGGPPATEVIAS